ncbi:MAG: Hsp20/alpha crystallin family protein [Anaerolineales bacterium]|nr:Hsp20/alpha crystallin family protein [Anaerolineales bacterium]
MSTLIWEHESAIEHPSLELQALGWQVSLHSYCWSPPTDIYETENRFVVRVEVAGMREMDFSIGVEKNFLIINGVRTDRREQRAYRQMEIRFGEFSTAVEIPPGVDVSLVEAEYEDGFLTVILLKSKALQKKRS